MWALHSAWSVYKIFQILRDREPRERTMSLRCQFSFWDWNSWKILICRTIMCQGLPRRLSGKEFTCHYKRCKRLSFGPWVRKIPWRRKWQPTPVFLPGKSHGQRSLVGYSPWGHKESDTTEWAPAHYVSSPLLSNRNPLMLKPKFQYFGHLMWRADSRKDPDVGKDWRQEEKGMT